MTAETLMDAATLASRVDAPDLVVVDCRFDLGDAEAGRNAFRVGHIPGAFYAHLDTDLSGPRTPWTGRHPLPDPQVLATTFGRLGIGPGIQVVAYDESAGMYAARLWWLLHWLGHRAAAVLDGGLAAWRAAELPLNTDPPTAPAREFKYELRRRSHVSADDVADLLAHRACLLLDARGAERFEGRVEPLDPKAGHVPGARNHPYARNLAPDGRFLSPDQLRAVFTPVLGDRLPNELVSMCGSGVTACHTLLALEIAGFGGGRLYPGSWSEWCRDPARPVATGP